MNILVISNSVIVKELIKLVAEDYDYSIEYQNSAKDAQDFNYCLVFIDDSSQDINSQLEFIKSKLRGDTVLLSSSKIEPNEYIDYTINKPFLPNDIKDILDRCKEFDKTKEQSEKIETSILDPQEIAAIKALMEMELDEEDSKTSEDERSYILMLEDKESLELKNKKAKKLLYELGSLGKKEFKKLLKGAKVSIKIEYRVQKGQR